MKIAGIIFIVLSTGSVGFGISAALKKRCRMIRQIISALSILKEEIFCRNTPLPQGFALMAASVQGVPERIFSHMAKEMNRNRWLSPREAMQRALEKETDISCQDPVAEAFLELSAELGKYDRENQVRVLDQTIIHMESLLQAAEQESSGRSKTYETLGICAGISMAILLI